MSKILIAGAGGSPSENVIKSILESKIKEEVIGMGSEPFDLVLSLAKSKNLIPYAKDLLYRNKLIELLNHEKPDLVHFQNDLEILEASRFRDDIQATGTKIFMPSHEVIENCVDKSKSYKIWENNGIKVPKTIDIRSENDLRDAFRILGDETGTIWIRANIGGGGRGALPTNDFDFAKLWIDRFNGWGNFTAAELLTSKSVTWLSIWHEGELVVAQGRDRVEWNFGNRTVSGVTGVTKVGVTSSNQIVTDIALKSIYAIDKKPHGIYGVDMTYDKFGFPNPTEINISRFFTTVYFFTKAGLNMPEIFKDIALYKKFPVLERKINPLPDGLLWIRSMDREPLLTTMEEVKSIINEI